MIKASLIFIIAALTAFANNSTPLGLPTTISDLYIPGGLVEVTPRKDNESSLVIRLLETKPAAKGFRYDFEVYGLDPGSHRLADFLRYSDTKEPLPDLDYLVKITTRHPLDTLPKPNELEPVPPDKVGGYKTLLIILAAIWTLVFLAIIFYRKKQIADFVAENPPPTLHQKLQVLVTTASQGDLTDQERANLERLILGHWKEKFPDLDSLPPAQALVELRNRPESAPLVQKLEEWLHAPRTSISQDEILPLLEPYRDSSWS